MKQESPFSLMFGKAPSSLIERQQQYQTVLDTFNSERPSTYAYMITGVRGCGKTVMMRQLASDFSKSQDWIVIDVNAQGEIRKDLSEKTLYEGKRFKLFLDWSVELDAGLLTLKIGKGEKVSNPEIIFERLLKKANESGKRVLITIDEITLTNETKLFANFYQSMIGKNYDLFLLMTGLKSNISAIVNSEASSFLVRTPTIELPPLEEIDIAREYQRILGIPFPTAAKFAVLTSGYAFAYQVLSYLLFETEAKELTDELLNKYDQYLQTNGYSVIWKELTNREKSFCFALASSANGEANGVAEAAGISSVNYQQYRKRLVQRGIVKAAGYGKTAFALPRFGEFVEAMSYLE